MSLNTNVKKIEPHVILHLKINKSDIEQYMENKIKTEFDESSLNNDPIPYDYYNINSKTFDKEVSSYNNYKEITPQEPVSYNLLINNVDINDYDFNNTNISNNNINRSDNKIKFIQTLRDFANANKKNKWPSHTNTWCMWDSHPFEGPPISIPKYYINDIFYVSGCYCSYSCAAADLFSKSSINENDKWTYFNLLHLLKKNILKQDTLKKIKLAPPKEVLEVFGGHLSIDNYRDINKETNLYHKIYDILEPPMISIIPTIQENNSKMNDTLLKIDNSNTMKYVSPKNETIFSSNKNFIPIDENRMKKAQKNIKLKRNIPLIDKKKTLIHYMNLKIKKK